MASNNANLVSNIVLMSTSGLENRGLVATARAWGGETVEAPRLAKLLTIKQLALGAELGPTY